jgi:excisionase family DNA binding protein
MNTRQAKAAARPTGKLLTLKECAERLNIIPRTLKRWISRKEFPPPIRKGTRWVRVPESVLDAWLQARAHDSAKSRPQGHTAEQPGATPGPAELPTAG